MYYSIHYNAMDKHIRTLSIKRFVKEASSLWPAAKGSLALVRKPCIHAGCPACRRGDKHPAFIYTYTRKGKKYCMYVPKMLVPVLKQAIKNGRQLEELMKQTGPALIKAYRERKKCVRQKHGIQKGYSPTAQAALRSNAKSTHSKKKTRG